MTELISFHENAGDGTLCVSGGEEQISHFVQGQNV